jgi:Zn-dependent metalloprotease
LNTTSSDGFVRDPQRQRSERYTHEHYNQFYKGAKVEDGGYNFHFKDGRMYLAHGHYVKIEGLNTIPSISTEKAADLFAEFKHIPKDSIDDFINELLIKEVPSITKEDATLVPKLVYRVYLLARHAQNDEVGFVDAHTGEVVATEPQVLDYSATATFETRYNDMRYATTQFYNSASGGPVIHTWNLDGDIYFHNAVELTDENNYWYADEYQASEDDMGLDIHWALQEIVDYLNDEHSINSFDDDGYDIDAYFHLGNSNFYKDRAGYDPNFQVLYFGDGAVVFQPIASLDAIAHEFGHGITDFQIGWSLSGDPLAFHEGLSDIWAVILENRINPNSIWSMGEEIMVNHGCLRNIAYPNGNNPYLVISDTYLSTRYNDTSIPGAVPYIRGGVFSHWFYLLVNGGTGTNSVYDDYVVYGIGMDAAEDLIIHAVMNNYLDNTSTYPQLRTAMIDAAEERFGENSLESMQVTNAWVAVGVGTQPAQAYISGPSVVCSSGSAFTVSNCPSSGTSIEWTPGPNLSRSSTQGSNPCTFTPTGSGSTWIRASLVSSSSSITLPQKDVSVGNLHDIELYCEGGSGGYVGDYYPLWVTPYYEGDFIVWDVEPYAEIIDVAPGYASIYFDTPDTYTISAYTANSCGTGNPSYIYDFTVTEEFLLSPNPASDYVTLIVGKGKKGYISSVKTFEVSILDLYGTLKSQNTYSGNRFEIPVQNLHDGTYFVKINNGKKSVTKQLIIKH